MVDGERGECVLNDERVLQTLRNLITSQPNKNPIIFPSGEKIESVTGRRAVRRQCGMLGFATLELPRHINEMDAATT